MRFVLLADIHGNFDALQAVLAEVERYHADATFCLGDIVGYGAEPERCMAEVRERRIPCIAGNHDFAAAGTTELSFFNAEAKESVLWTRSQLSAEELRFLADLPLVRDEAVFALAHGSFVAPESFEYVLNALDAAVSLERMKKPCGFVAHTHVPGAFVLEGNLISVRQEETFRVPDGSAALINVGSVGQPRDTNPMAAYALFDTESRSVDIRRVAYNVDSAAQKILAAGLPPINAYRLYLGR